jgi:cob(I)alamin adenosyltransferase
MDITRLVPKERKGLVVVITGYGKGKTTTGLGIAVRACGHNMRICMIQFMKGDIYAGEWDGVKKMDCEVELIPTGKGFCGIQGNPYPYKEHRKNAQEAIQLAHQKMESIMLDSRHTSSRWLSFWMTMASYLPWKRWPTLPCCLSNVWV